MIYLSDSALSAYMSLLTKLMDSKFDRLANIGFTSKKLKGKTYWYAQYTDVSGERKQRYMGPDSPELLEKIGQLAKKSETQAVLDADTKRMVAMIIAAGGVPVIGKSAKIIEKLADAGVFDSGGLLIGSYAFGCFGNMLGVSFRNDLLRTEDMDLAYDTNIEVGFIRDIRDDIQSANPEMQLPSQINPWVPAYEMKAPDGFKVEFLTARKHPSEKQPIPIESFGIHAQTIEFLDYITSDTVKAVMLYSQGILVSVPNPARYAVHKLAVSVNRPAHEQGKAKKDLMQTSALFEFFLENNPGALLIAADDAKSRDDELKTFIETGMKRAGNHLPPNKLKFIEQFKEQCWNEASCSRPTFKN